jgi:hypothetical protein
MTDDGFRDRLLGFISSITYECMPPEPLAVHPDHVPGQLVFLPFPNVDDPDFDEIMSQHVDDIVSTRQMHSTHHTATCFKYGKSECRLRFPRELCESTAMDPLTGVIRLRRDDPWLNGYNPWIALTLRSNHDVQFLLTKDHALSIVYYIIKYISKNEQTLHSKLSIAAAVRAAQLVSTAANTEIGKQMIRKVYNKIESHREVGLPEAVSHLLELPDYYTDADFPNINTTQLLSYFKQPNSSSLAGVINNLATTDVEDRDSVQDMLDSQIVAVGRQFKIINVFDDYRCRGDSLASCSLYNCHKCRS